jgi:hypothetical protein
LTGSEGRRGPWWVEKSKNVDRKGMSREIGEQHGGHGQGGVQVHGHGDGDEEGERREWQCWHMARIEREVWVMKGCQDCT